MVRTKEREETYGWHNEKTRIGWFTDGDYRFLNTAEEYFLPRDLVTEESYDAEAPDAMLSAVPAHPDAYDRDDGRCRHCYELWGAKTQGEPYHMYLLAVACLIESRLGPKAYVYGDITRGQCEKAVRMANEHLENKIHTPDRCDSNRLLQRIANLRLSESEKLKLYTSVYLGNQDAAFGKGIRDHFSESVCDEYWQGQFGRYQIAMHGFHDVLEDYLLWGFELEKLCSFVQFCDAEGNEHYEEFVKRIMDAKLHHKEKDCRDFLKIDQNTEEPYSIWTLFAQLAYGGARNKKIDRYIPIEEIKSSLHRAIGSHCSVKEIIDQYLEEEKAQEIKDLSGGDVTEEEMNAAIKRELSRVFTETMEIRSKALQEERERYDISEADDLPYYEAGDTMHPAIMESVGKIFSFYRSTLEEETFKRFMKGTPDERCRCLVSQNRSILLRDKDWERIFDDIFEHEDSFSRYYPMVRLKTSSEEVLSMIRAFVVNDELYSYAFELERQFADSEP